MKMLRESRRRQQPILQIISVYIHLTQGKKGNTKKKCVVNTNNKLIQAIERLYQKQPKVATSLAAEVYDLALLSQKEIELDELNRIFPRQAEILEKTPP